VKRIGLVGCVKEKSYFSQNACDLYTSTLFKGRRLYVEASCTEWWILSAKHGLVHPEELLSPYDFTLKEVSKEKCREWSMGVLEEVDKRVAPSAGDIFEIHAGIEYRHFGLVDGITGRECLVVTPTEGMSIGEQLRFYKEKNRLPNEY